MTPLMKPAEVAAALNISPRTLRGLIRDGLIAYVITGRGKKRPGIGFEPAEIERFKAERSRREYPPTILKVAPSIRMASDATAGSFLALRKLRQKTKRGG